MSIDEANHILQRLLSQFQLTNPWFLLLGLLLPVFWLRWREVNLAVLLTRSAIFLLLVVVLAGPEMVHEISVTEPEKRIFAFDLSRSIPNSARLWMARMARQNLALSSEDRVLVFGGKTQEAQDWERWIRGETSQAGIEPEQTNFEALFSNLLKPSDSPRKLFLFTDGWETQGDIQRLLPSLRSANLKVFPMVPPRYDTANVAVKKIIAPHQGTFGENVQLRVMLDNDNNKPVEGTLVLKRSGQPFKSDPVTLKPGSQILTFEATLGNDPFGSFEASFTARTAGADVYSQDNRSTAWISAQAKEKVMLLNGQSGQEKYLEDLLRRRGFEVNSLTVANTPPAPSGYGLIIFNNVEREKFSESYLSAIERHTAAGNAFLMLGGDQSFGPTSYKKTAIEAVLPVEAKDPPKKEEKNRAVILVIDKSGSMREENRILYAREAAKAVARQLKDNDLLGVVAFDISPFIVVPMDMVGRLRGSFDAQIDRLKPGGQTFFYPALVEAKRQLEKQNAGYKHIILLSDGETRGSQGELIDLVNLMKTEMKITVSALAVGSEADIRTMKRISQYGGGLFHHTSDPRTLPQLAVQQIQEKPRDELPKEKILTPVAVRGSKVLGAFQETSFPVIRGYVETDLKKGANLDLAIRENRHPLLASWNYRTGKAAAFTTDLQGFWTRDWVRWPELEKFWNEVFNWLKPVKEALPPHEVRINVAEDRPILDLYLYAEESADSVFRYNYRGKEAQGEGVLKKLAPGHYQTVLPFSARGDYRIDLFEEGHGQKRAYPSLGYTLAFNPRAEIPRRHANLQLLERLAEASGGQINPTQIVIAKTEKTSRTATSLRPPLIILNALLFLLEIYVRRFVLRLPIDA